MQEGQDHYIKKHFWKRNLENGHRPVINFSFANNALQNWNSDKCNKQARSRINSS